MRALQPLQPLQLQLQPLHLQLRALGDEGDGRDQRVPTARHERGEIGWDWVGLGEIG